MTLSIPWADTPYIKIWVGNQDLGVIPHFIKSFTYTLNIGGGASQSEIVLFDPNYDQLENAIIADENKIEFEWGWANGNKSARHPALVHSVQPRFVWGQGTEITIQAIDRASEALMNGKSGFSFTKDQLASDAALLMARKYNLKPVVETSKPIGRNMAQSATATDFSFMTEIAKTQPAFQFYIWQGTELHFHTEKSNPNAKIYKHSVGRDRDGLIIDFEPEITHPAQSLFGGQGMRVLAYDPIKKEVIDYTANNASASGLPAGGKSMPKEDADAPRTMRVPFFTFDDAQKAAQARYYTYSQTCFSARVEMYGDPEIQAGEFLDISVMLPEIETQDGNYSILPQRSHYTSGIYEILTVTHSINDSGSYTCSLDCRRRGFDKNGKSLDVEQPNGPKIAQGNQVVEPAITPTPGSKAANDIVATRKKTSQDGTILNAPTRLRNPPPGSTVNGNKQ